MSTGKRPLLSAIAPNGQERLVVLLHSSDRAGFLTWNGNMHDCMERTYIHTLAAADTSLFIDMSLAVDEHNGILGAVSHAWACETAAACIADTVLVRRTAIASCGDCGEKRKHRRILCHDLSGVFAQRLHFIIIAFNIDTEKSHDAVAHDCPFLVDTAPVRCPVLRNNRVRQLIKLVKLSLEEKLQDFSIDTTFHRSILVVEFKHFSLRPP